MVRQATRILKNQNFNEVLSTEKSGFRFLNTDFGFPIKRGIQKQFLTPRNLSLDFPTVRFCGKSEKRFAKLSSRTTVSHAHSFLPEKRPLFTSTVLQIFFRISPLPPPPPPKKKAVTKEIHETRIWIYLLKSTLTTDFSPFSDLTFYCIKNSNTGFKI